MILKKIFRKVIDYKKSSVWRNSITLYPFKKFFSKNKSKGFVLLSYLTAPFYKKENDPIFKTHSNHWECYQIAKIFLDEGYCVDVINWDNKEFLPKKNYKVFIDIHSNLERLSPHLNKDCIKILHITGAHWIYQNFKEYSRLMHIQNTRNVTLIPRRVVPPSMAIEFANLATTVGNEFTISTFNYAKKEIYRIPISSSVLFDFPENKNFEKCKKNYLWLGSAGLVLKGLDIVLEVFKNLPDYKLFVCGPIKNEKDFEKAFYKELYETKNICTYGWVDLESEKFKEIYENCIGIVYPSFSEGGGGSVISCMHAGLIPIVTRESSVDIENFGFLITDITVKGIENLIKKISSLDTEELKLRSIAAWNYARQKHTRDSFTREYKKFVKEKLGL